MNKLQIDPKIIRVSDLGKTVKMVGYLLAAHDFRQSQQIVWPVENKAFATDVQSALPVNDMLEEIETNVYRPVNVFGGRPGCMILVEDFGIHPTPEQRLIPSFLHELDIDLQGCVVSSLCTARGKTNRAIQFKVALPSIQVVKYCFDVLKELGVESTVEFSNNDNILIIEGTGNLRKLSNINKKWRVTELVSE